MKRIFFIGILLGSLNLLGAIQAEPVEHSAVARINSQQPNPGRPAMQKNKKREFIKPDSTVPKKRKQPRLRPDSLRRGGATRVDTVR